MESKKINQLATSVNPQTSDLTIIGDPVTGVSKKITLLQIANLFATTGTVSSVAVTETGDALTITGSPITSAGTINIGFAGAANQYVRGDGALADFPTSTGGGSSVSYYLNSSVSQGTIGGVAYRELNKEPVIGAGTDITISANGYIASYITDANDPDVLSVPGGNFNCEFYFSVNSDAHNPSFYAELYKYDGTTFTLLGTSQAVPEYLSNGTTISPYYFAIPVPTTALALTDRLAIRIYVDVDTRIVTLHTENSHLCQVVTTFSKGMVSLNNLTDQSQFITTGTSGTDFNIVSSGDTHTFNIPSASASNRGLITTGGQTIAGSKTFNNAINAESGVLLKNGFTTYSNSYTSLGGNIGNLIISGSISSTPFDNELAFTPSTSNIYTFPNASGTIALTSNLSAYVPYTGATTNVNLGVYNLTANKLIAGGASVDNVATFTTFDGGVATQLIGSTGNLKFFPFWNPSIGARINAENSAGSAYIPLSFYASNFYFHSNVNFNSTIGNGTFTYTLPAATGTLALTSNLSAYLPLTGGTLTGNLTINPSTTDYTLTVSTSTTNNTIKLLGSTASNTSTIGYWSSNGGTGYGALNFTPTNTRFEIVNGGSFSIYTSGNERLTVASGGTTTLTGALNGTSATFSSSIFVNSPLNNTVITTSDATNITNGFNLLASSSYWGIRTSTNGNFNLDVFGAGVPKNALIIAQSTGAATFSSSVTANGLYANAGNSARFYRGANDYYWGVNNDSNNYLNFGAYLANGTAYGTNPKMILLDNGNVGIGTSSPDNYYSTKLVVAVGDENGITIAGTGDNFLMFADGQTGLDRYRGFIHYSHDSNFLAFGSDATERMRITSGGNVGIGTSSPSAKLDVYDASSSVAYVRTGSQILKLSASTSKVDLDNIAGDPMSFSIGGSERMRITSGGNVGFNGSSDVANVNDKFSLGYFNSNYGWLQTWSSTPLYLNKLGNAVYAGSVRLDTLSDERVKDNIQPIENALSKVLSITGKKFHLKDEDESKIRYGFIAQELEGVLDEFVIQTDITFKHKELEVKNVKSIENWASSWAALLVEAIKEQQAQIEAQQQQIEELKQLILNK